MRKSIVYAAILGILLLGLGGRQVQAAIGSWSYGDGYIYYGDSYGRLGIGTVPAPGTSLHVKNAGRTSQMLVGNDNAADSIWINARDGGSATNWNGNNYITVNGYVDNSTGGWKKRLSDKGTWNINMSSGAGSTSVFAIQHSIGNGVGAISNWKDVFMVKADGRTYVNELIVKNSSGGTWWADYVFEDDYKLKTLSEVEDFIEENNHLPGVPSAKEVEANGISVGEMQRIQMEKIEELTLYILQLEKRISGLEGK